MEQKKIALIALDLDGTVFTHEKKITPRTMAALTAAAQTGAQIVPASGRTAAGLPTEILNHPGVHYAISSNGARVMELATGESLAERYVPHALSLAAYDALQKYDCLVDLFQDGKGYTTKENAARILEYVPAELRAYVKRDRMVLADMRSYIDSQEKGIEKFTLFFSDDAERAVAWKEMEALGLEVVSSVAHNMELNALGVNKGCGLEMLAKKLGIPMENTMAVGDGGNDIAMLRAAGLGVAMGNAFPEVKAAADAETADNEHDGVALAIETYVLGR